MSAQGVFESAFKGKPSPLLEAKKEGETPQNNEQGKNPVVGTIEESPETARLVVIGSGEFLDDTVFSISSNLTRDRYLNSLKLIQNAVDWSTEDLDLLGIRARGASARVLVPMSEKAESMWEFGNYAVALLALLSIGLVWSVRRRNEEPMELLPRKAVSTSRREAR